MTAQEAKIVKAHITSIFSTWHACGLRKAERGMPVGTLCDDCYSMIDAHMKDIRRECGDVPNQGGV